MKDIFVYNDEFGNECTFLRNDYYNHVCSLITDFFEEPLPNNDFHKHFVRLLNEMKNYDSVNAIEMEYPSYWAISIIENDWTIKSVIKGKTEEELLEWEKRYYKRNNIVRYIIEGINQETYVFTNEEGGKSIFLRKKYYEFVCALVNDFFRKSTEFNDIQDTVLNRLNALPASGNYNNISEYIKEPYYWAMSIIENEWTVATLNNQQLEDYHRFLNEFYKENNMTSFIISDSADL